MPVAFVWAKSKGKDTPPTSSGSGEPLGFSQSPGDLQSMIWKSPARNMLYISKKSKSISELRISKSYPCSIYPQWHARLAFCNWADWYREAQRTIHVGQMLTFRANLPGDTNSSRGHALRGSHRGWRSFHNRCQWWGSVGAEDRSCLILLQQF